VARAGTIGVSIANPGVQSRTETLDVSAITWTASANSTENTTAIDFVFSATVTGLTADQITVEAGTVAVTTGVLTGGGTAWSLAVTVEHRGNVSVSIDRPGVEAGPRTVSVYVPPFRMISAGGNHTMAIRDGELWAWGSNAFAGQLGDGTRIDRDTPTRIGERSDWTHVSAGGNHTKAIREDGTLWAWGHNLDGRTGLGILANTAISIPTQVGTATDWVYVSAGNAHTMGIREDASGNRTLWAWGNNGSGRLGIGGTTSQNLPQLVGTNWATVSAGTTHTVAIGTNGSLWAWGSNGNRQLGDGTATNRNLPTRIGTATNWASVSAGSVHTVAIRTDGSLWVWGSNSSSELGDGTTTMRASPFRIGADNDWASATAGNTHTLAIRTTGTLWAWGSNTNGRLGDGTTTARNIPVLIQLGTTWASVSAGTNHSTAVREDGTFRVWGHNQFGQLGEDRETTQRLSPTLVTIP